MANNTKDEISLPPLPSAVSLTPTDVAIAQTAATARAEIRGDSSDTCAVCDGEFIAHIYGALGHDWRPKEQT